VADEHTLVLCWCSLPQRSSTRSQWMHKLIVVCIQDYEVIWRRARNLTSACKTWITKLG
jgi:hypothetical protein